MRHIIASINSLPETYSGKLTILANDPDSEVTARNACLLNILASVSDISLAVDMAVHFWYSISMPPEYNWHLSLLLKDFISQISPNEGKGPIQRLTTTFGNSCKACFILSPTAIMRCCAYGAQRMTMQESSDEHARVRNWPSMKEKNYMMYMRLRPSHRVAFWQYRSFGLLLPHGAANAHFSIPNDSLFGSQKEWLQSGSADPIGSWK